jgi:OOP family OmpA-OmpF porin
MLCHVRVVVSMKTLTGGDDTMRWILTVLVVALLVPVLVAGTASAACGGKDCKYDKCKTKGDKEITEFIYDVTIPWPFRKHAGDADGDGVTDKADKCPGTPRGVVVDATGCPKDSDGDGVYDGIDKCPETPKGARVDASGCPGDEDGDGVVDGVDKCPGTPKGATVDGRGCPSDSDGDGVYDGIDKCPNTPKGTRVDKAGCPITKVEQAMLDTGVFRTSEIVFDTDKAVIKPESHEILGEIGAALVAHPELKVEIGGHTDSVGTDSYNQTLSEERAQAVLDYLVKNFAKIEKGQFSTKGYGEGSPIASNNTAEGRAKNRRVEFKVLKK